MTTCSAISCLLYADEDSRQLCETVCMVQYFPVDVKEHVTDCKACAAQQSEVGYEQYDQLHAMLEVSINSNSLLPEVMRLRWFPTNDDPIFSGESGIQVRWHPWIEFCVVLCCERCHKSVHHNTCNMIAKMSLSLIRHCSVFCLFVSVLICFIYCHFYCIHWLFCHQDCSNFKQVG